MNIFTYKNIFFTLLVIVGYACLQAQDLPVVLQAKSGTLGSDFRTVDTLAISAVITKTDVVNTSNPGNANRVITFQVTFADSGLYDLYAHVLVGKDGFSDDSYFYGNGFGVKNASTDADWVRANGLAAVGYTASTSVVDGGGGASTLVWKWVNMSKYTADAPPRTFRVELGALTQTFQIGARESGLYIDKFVFGHTGLYFTVANLTNGEAGSKQNPNDVPLGNPIAKGKSKFLGSEWDYVQAPCFAGYWNQITPGNAGKWGSVEGTRNVMNWTDLDSTYHVARRAKFPFKEHTLIWGAQQPSWIGSLDAATQRQEIEQWFSALASRYDSIAYIDVVNEPIHNAPNGMVPWGTTQPNVNYANALGGAGSSGWDWILTSFRLARQYFPKSKLILNEYSVINDASTTQKYLQIINLLKAENLIDGIGEQAHAFTTYGTSTSFMKSNLDALAATGIPIYLTELDVDGATDLIQLQEYQRIFPTFWEHPGIKGITLWGYRYGVWRNTEGAYLITETGKERPALTWLKAYVNDTLKALQSIAVSASNGSTSISTKGGTLNMTAAFTPINATIRNVTWSVSPVGKATIDANGLLTATADGTVTVTATSWDGSSVVGSANVVITNQSTAVNNLTATDQITVTPNPAVNGNATIHGMAGIDKIEVYDLNGRKIAAYYPVKQSSLDISIHGVSGVYIIKLYEGNQVLYKKVVVKN